jgi:acyl carrier protein
MERQATVESAVLEKEVKQFIIDTLALEEVTPDEIGSEMPLFGDGLGLDSVDALELGVALQKQYGIKLDPKDDATRHYFSSVKTLAQLVHERRGAA